MNCCDANGDCRQGRTCSCRELPTPAGDDFLNFDWVMRWLWTGFAWLGFFSTLALIAFFFGYAS